MSLHDDFSIPDAPPDSPGSSVSTRLQEEYDELLKYAVVVPKYDPNSLPQTLTDARESFQQQKITTHVTVTRERGFEEDESDADSDVTPVVVRVSKTQDGLPDFGQSPIRTQEEPERDGPYRGRPVDRYFTARLAEEIQRRETEQPNQQDVSEERFETEKIYTATIDPDVAKMENLMDQWCLDLKRNILAEFSQSKIRIVEMGKQQLHKEQERHATEKSQLLNEIDSLKELLHTYEQSIERKDQVISNLTHAMQKQRDKYDMLKKFCEWKIRHNDLKREGFASNLARRHHKRQLSQKVWDAWHSVIESKWRQRVEKACQGKAQEVCIQLTNDYENKIASLNEALEEARNEVNKLHIQRDRYEETMKKAFMRGVCALNLEAMSMFQNGEEQTDGDRKSADDDYSDNLEGSLPEKDFGAAKTIPQEPVFTSAPRHEGPIPKVITSQGARSTTSTFTQSKSQSSKSGTVSSKGKVLTTKISAKVDTGRSGSGLGGTNGAPLAPPMSSVIVERHQPVTKQTLGHATASRFPRQSSAPSYGESQGGIVHRRIAGQSGSVNIIPNIQTVKLVE